MNSGRVCAFAEKHLWRAWGAEGHWLLPARQGLGWESLEEFAIEEDRLVWQGADTHSSCQQNSFLLRQRGNTVAYSSAYPQQCVTESKSLIHDCKLNKVLRVVRQEVSGSDADFICKSSDFLSSTHPLYKPLDNTEHLHFPPSRHWKVCVSTGAYYAERSRPQINTGSWALFVGQWFWTIQHI